MSVVYSFSSGKGGVGKSTIAAGIAMALSVSGSSVVLIDADIGLRSLDSLLLMENHIVYDIIDAVNHDCSLDQALVPVPDFQSLYLLPAAQFSRSRELDRKKLEKIILFLRYRFDYILIDCPAGIERGFRNILNARAVDRHVLVLTPDDLCIRDAERVAGIMEKKNAPAPSLIINRIIPSYIRSGDMYPAGTISGLLDLPLLGEIPEDRSVYLAQLKHTPLLSVDCEFRNAVMRIAARIKGSDIPLPGYGTHHSFHFRKRNALKMKEVVGLDDQ